jgi:uncharacterized membrane protein YjgN (DUF898 family)
MSDLRYDVVFNGEVLPGFMLESVKTAFSDLFKISEERVEKIFSGARVTLKSGLEQGAAQKYQRTLESVGAVILLNAQPQAKIEDSVESIDSESADDAISPAVAVAESSATESDFQTDNSSAEDAVASDRDHAETIDDGGSTAQVLDTPRDLRFQFHGRGGEYFKIWIVNLVLSILTLGIYSAWAKVRNKQYFYGNTEFEGSTFSYLASPITILKGRLIAMAILIAYSFATNTPVWWVSAFAVLGMILVSPFFVQRSLMFNARNSAYRNIRFNFGGSFKEAALIFAALPIACLMLVAGTMFLGQQIGALWLGGIAVLLVFALAMPYFVFRQKDYFVGNSEFGTTAFEFSATRADFFATWGKLVLWTILAFVGAMLVAGVVGAIFGVSMASLGGDGEAEAGAMAAMIPMLIAIYLIMGVAYLFPFIYYSVKINNLVFNNTSIDGFQLNANYALGSYGKLVLVNTLLTVLTLGFFRPWAMVRTARYKAEHMSVVAVHELDTFVAAEEQHVSALGEEVGDFYDLDFGF